MFADKQRWSRGHKVRGQGQGHKKIRGQGQGPRTQGQVTSKKKRSSIKRFRRSQKKGFAKKFFKRSQKEEYEKGLRKFSARYLTFSNKF